MSDASRYGVALRLDSFNTRTGDRVSLEENLANLSLEVDRRVNELRNFLVGLRDQFYGDKKRDTADIKTMLQQDLDNLMKKNSL